MFFFFNEMIIMIVGCSHIVVNSSLFVGAFAMWLSSSSKRRNLFLHLLNLPLPVWLAVGNGTCVLGLSLLLWEHSDHHGNMTHWPLGIRDHVERGPLCPSCPHPGAQPCEPKYPAASSPRQAGRDKRGHRSMTIIDRCCRKPLNLGLLLKQQTDTIAETGLR